MVGLGVHPALPLPDSLGKLAVRAICEKDNFPRIDSGRLEGSDFL
jgi:hypothetical protein